MNGLATYVKGSSQHPNSNGNLLWRTLQLVIPVFSWDSALEYVFFVFVFSFLFLFFPQHVLFWGPRSLGFYLKPQTVKATIPGFDTD